ncbi:MAG TPA: bacillithiol biosynthesis cysteine-adding enzyme BshC [Bryobacteraceae bacterium]|nr:bacillithiol biosynthesis cysteine-adding enzyme BshC [Bryobacteraceae bacterium]
MECSCVRHSDVPGTSKLFTDLVQHFDRVSDLYPIPPNRFDSLKAASKFDFPDDRRAALVRALTPLNEGNPSLRELAKPGTVAIVTGQQVGLFSGPAYSIYKALSAIRIAESLTASGIPAVPVFWIATEDHDFAEIDHVWVFGAAHRPAKIQLRDIDAAGARPAGGIVPGTFPLGELRRAMQGLPFLDEAMALAEQAYQPGASMGGAFAELLRALFRRFGLLIIDPMDAAIRQLRAPLMRQAVERMPELVEALIARSRELVSRGYHAQVLVDQKTSLAFLLEGGERLALKRNPSGEYIALHHHLNTPELAGRAAHLSPNALLRPVIQDYLLPTAAYIGGPAELAYLAQSQVVYRKLGQRQPAALPRVGFTLIDERGRKRMARYGVGPADLFVREQVLHDRIAKRLVPQSLRDSLQHTRAGVEAALSCFASDLDKFDGSLASALKTSRRKIEYQMGKIERKTAAQIMARDEQATRDAALLSGLVYPETHLQERFYSILPLIAKFGPGLIDELHAAIRIDCPDHQFAVV